MSTVGKIAFIGISLALMPMAHAAEDSRGLYAYGMGLETQVDSAIYQLLLPDDVYGGSVHADLSDVRVLNAKGTMLPSLIETTDGDGKQQESIHELPFFYLNKALDNRRNANIHITTGKDGAIVNIIDKRGEAKSRRQWVYIVDMTAYAGKVASLQLLWKKTPSNRIINIGLASSDDLHHWQKLDGASISYLQHEGRRLQRNVIELAHSRARYLQLSSSDDLQGYELSAIKAKVFSTGKQRSPMRTKTLTAVPGQDQEALVYDAGALLPVSRLGVDFGAQNGVADLQVYARASTGDDWRRLGESTFYSYHIGGKSSQSEDLSVLARMVRYFRLVPADKHILAGELPTLRLAWHPHRLSFLAQGEGPYMLVYGRADSEPLNTAMGKLVQSVDQREQEATISKASPGNQLLLCGKPCLEAKTAAINYTRYILWLVIIAGVVLMLWMVRGLYRDMNRG